LLYFNISRLTDLHCPMCYEQISKDQIQPENIADFILENSQF